MNSASTAELGSDSADSADSADSVKTGLDAFLTWAEERGTPVSPRAAHAVLTLLALRGARRRAGFPEPTAELVTTVLHQDLPAFAAASREELADYPAVLVVLADRTHEARLLNAKARAQMVAGIEANAAVFFERMMDPGRLTWLRLYAGLMRTDHVRPDDPDAVAGWLRDFADRPADERRAAVRTVLADGDGHPLDKTGVVVQQRLMLVAAQTENALLTLRSQVLQSLNADLLGLINAGAGERAPLIDLPDDGRPPSTHLDTLVLDLLGRWSAAGLPAALDTEYDHLAPLPDGLPSYELSARLLVRCREIWGEEPGDVPPPLCEIAQPERMAELLRAAPLPAALARVAGWAAERGGVACVRQKGAAENEGPASLPEPDEADLAAVGELISLTDPLTVREVWNLAVSSGFLRLTGSTGTEVKAVAGDAYAMWAEAGPAEAAELAELAADLAGAYLRGLADVADRVDGLDIGGAYELVLALVEDLPYTLMRLYGQQEPESLIRMAAVLDSWALRASTDDEDPVPPPGFATGSPQYPPLAELLRTPSAPDEVARAALLPPEGEMARLLGADDIDDEERAELADLAHWQVLLLDRFYALGLVIRGGDSVSLTSLGAAVLRHLLWVGGIPAPTMAEVGELAAGALMAAAGWPESVAAPAVTTWFDHRGWSADAWREFLAAMSALHGTNRASRARRLFGLLGVTVEGEGERRLPPQPLSLPLPQGEAELRTALTEAIADPVIGAYAAEALNRRTTVPSGEAAAVPPTQARAVMLVDRLSWLMTEELRASRDEASAEQQPPRGTALCKAFDDAAGDWPGGAAQLIPALGRADPRLSRLVLETLAAAHPERAVVAQAARLARRQGAAPAKRR